MTGKFLVDEFLKKDGFCKFLQDLFFLPDGECRGIPAAFHLCSQPFQDLRCTDIHKLHADRLAIGLVEKVNNAAEGCIPQPDLFPCLKDFGQFLLRQFEILQVECW